MPNFAKNVGKLAVGAGLVRYKKKKNTKGWFWRVVKKTTKKRFIWK